MLLIPAIDIRGGRCVRLLQGDFGRETLYDHDPVELAARYRDLGARWLHVVDLDGAKSGSPAHLDTIREMARGSRMRIQLGGGIRDARSLAEALAVADRVVIGSLAATDPDLVSTWLREFGADRLTLGLDVKVAEDSRPMLMTHGWTKSSSWSLDAALDLYVAQGLTNVLCTDIERDGAMLGPNTELYSSYAATWPQIRLQASGGVRNAEDLESLAKTGVHSAISGRALLDGTISDEEMMRFLPNE